MQLAFILTQTVWGQQDEANTWLLQQKLPDWTTTTLKKLKLDSLYKLSDFINPFYIEADFDGDNKSDIAVATEQTKTKKKGIIILHRATGRYFVLGAGNNFGNGGDNFDWMDIWKVYTDKKISPGVGEIKPMDLKVNGIYIAKSESSGGVIFWTGNKYKWYQHGD